MWHLRAACSAWSRLVDQHHAKLAHLAAALSYHDRHMSNRRFGHWRRLARDGAQARKQLQLAEHHRAQSTRFRVVAAWHSHAARRSNLQLLAAGASTTCCMMSLWSCASEHDVNAEQCHKLIQWCTSLCRGKSCKGRHDLAAA